MKISLYTAAKNAIVNDLHAEAMLRHHLPLADEIIVNEGFSSDDTFERISNIDPKIRIFRSQWEAPKDLAWCIGFKDAARRQCTGDWCIHLDCDEFIPEWEFDAIRSYLSTTQDTLIPTKFINFYGNHRVFHAAPEKVFWPTQKMIIHRNLPDIEFWGDGSNVKLKGEEFSWNTSSKMFTVHHMGMIRDAAVLRQKWYIQGRAVAGKATKFTPPMFVFRMFPHKWNDPQFFPELQLYEGQDIRAVRDDPREFIRDNLSLVKALERA